MASNDLARTVIGIIGNIISLILFLSPMPTFIGILKKKDVEQFSPFPYLATLLNCYLWVLYGLPIVKPDSTLILTINGAGIVIELAYIAMFAAFAPAKKRIQVILTFLAETALVFIVGALIISFIHTKDRRALVVGILCIIFCIMMYGAPLSVMKMVIQTKSVEFMPLYLSVASFCNGTCWTIYSLLRFDINILVPNGIGLLFSVVQLVLYFVYYKSTREILAERKRAEIGLTNIEVRGEPSKAGNGST